jgi:alkylhydroperoxidase family enzyme
VSERSATSRSPLTHLAAEIDEADIDALRAQGLDDVDISDAIQVVSYFNYVTRVADGVGIEDEPEWDRQRRDASI